MARQVALLRGINLGAQRRVAMPALRELLRGAGFGEVRTHLQSGNVILDSDAAPGELARELKRIIADSLGVEAAVVVRTRDELAEVIARNPLAGVATDPRLHQVTFFAEEPDGEIANRIRSAAASPEQVVVDGREAFAWHPGGIRRSRLAAALADQRLGVTATARNWRTAAKLLELAGE